jgi:hypothetical protein
VVNHLPSKHKALSANSNNDKKKVERFLSIEKTQMRQELAN